jgi:6-pyruvoyl-tetrahydropterin synthase
MESFVTARTSFWGSHTLKNHPEHGRQCGHSWTVTVTVAGEEDADRWMMPIDEGKFEQELWSFSQELRGRDIDTMLKPSLSTDMGICHWFYEKLAIRYDVREVRCWHDDHKTESMLRAP